VIDAGAPAVVAIGGEPVITGYIDKLDSDISDQGHSITFSGRSKSADLVDCAALNSPGSWKNRSLQAIASEIAAPFGIRIIAEASTGAPFKSFALQQGETAWEAIERMLKQRALLGITDAQGNVRLVTPKPGAASLTITEGREIRAMSATHDVSERFSKYVVKGQAAGDNHAHGKTVAGPKAQASDPAVGRYRPLIVIAEDQVNAASLAVRAQFEASVRAARAQSAQVTLQDWRQPGGKLWAAMELVTLVAPSGWIDHAMMAVSVIYRVDGKGKRVEIKYGRPEAQVPVPKDAKASSITKQGDAARLGRVK
jgi:prophage tail gpP-like protein